MPHRAHRSILLLALGVSLSLLAGVAQARVAMVPYPSALYLEARSAGLRGEIEEAGEIASRMVLGLREPLYAVDLATACGSEPVASLLDRLREVNPVFLLPEERKQGAKCYRVLFGLFPSQEGAEQLVAHLPPVALYPPSLVALEESEGEAVRIREVRVLAAGLREEPAADPPAAESALPPAGPEAAAEAVRLFEEGKQALLAGELEKAERAFRRVLELDPSNVSARHNLGTIYIYLNRPEDAADQLRQALDVDPGYPRAHMNLGIAYLRLGRAEEALVSLRQAVELLPGDFEVRYLLAAAYAETGRKEEALRAVAKALAIRPEEPRALELRSALQKMPDETAPTTPSLAQREEAPRGPSLAGRAESGPAPPPAAPPRRPTVSAEADARFRRGLAAYEKGNLRVAEREYREALVLDGANPNLYNNLGALYLEQGRLDEAEDAFRRAMSLDPDQVKGRVNLGAVLYRQGKQEQGMQLLREALALAPEDAEVLYRLALLYAHSGQREQARELVGRAVAADSFHVRARALQEALRTGAEAVYVSEPAVFLREGAGNIYPTLGTAEFGDRLLLLERGEEWCLVRRPEDGIEGWVLARVLTSQVPRQ
jgi:Flp pilus assembly protein TadD